MNFNYVSQWLCEQNCVRQTRAADKVGNSCKRLCWKSRCRHISFASPGCFRLPPTNLRRHTYRSFSELALVHLLVPDETEHYWTLSTAPVEVWSLNFTWCRRSCGVREAERSWEHGCAFQPRRIRCARITVIHESTASACVLSVACATRRFFAGVSKLLCSTAGAWSWRSRFEQLSWWC